MGDQVEATGPSRRTVMKGAVWGAPVVAVAVATPLAAASTEPEPPAATFAQQLWDVVAPEGVQSQFALYGRAVLNGTLVDAVLPDGATVTFTPPAGGTVTVSSIVSGVATTNADGSVTVTYASGLTEALVYLSFTGVGTAVATGYVPGLTPETFTVSQTILAG